MNTHELGSDGVIPRSQLDSLYNNARAVYSRGDLPFHGWSHIEFVVEVASEVAIELGADQSLVLAASLVHDLNHLILPGSDASEGHSLRKQMLIESGLGQRSRSAIERVVDEAQTHKRGTGISLEGMALSDGDSAYKALPITPVLLSHHYLDESGLDVFSLAERIIRDQAPLMTQGIYFYSRCASARFGAWAKTNLDLWRAVLESREDPDVRSLVTRLV